MQKALRVSRFVPALLLFRFCIIFASLFCRLRLRRPFPIWSRMCSWSHWVSLSHSVALLLYAFCVCRSYCERETQRNTRNCCWTSANWELQQAPLPIKTTINFWVFAYFYPQGVNRILPNPHTHTHTHSCCCCGRQFWCRLWAICFLWLLCFSLVHYNNNNKSQCKPQLLQ